MPLTKPYADYNWYATAFSGNTIPEGDFPAIATQASYLVDGITAGNLKYLDEAPDCLRDAVCAAAEKLYLFQSSPAKDIKSENNDGLTITYVDTSEEKAILDAQKAIRFYLCASGLLFRGCQRC